MSPLSTRTEEMDPRRKSALIVEGGAMRGAWAAGVLAFLHEHGESGAQKGAVPYL